MKYDDTSRHPNRRVPPEPEQTEVGQPHLVWESGKQFPIKDTGWMNRNSKYIEDVQFQPGGGQAGELRVYGHHPKRGEFHHTVPFEDRGALREVLQRPKWDHVNVDDQMRDGGGPQHRREVDAFYYGITEHPRHAREQEI
jgi:hypothetical protein